jgi:hypothetical protein
LLSQIAVDSVAAIARKQSMSEADKELMLVRAASELLRLADLTRAVVLVSNQVYMKLSSSPEIPQRYTLCAQIATVTKSSEVSNSGMGPSVFGSSSYQPALGMIWSHCITARLSFTAPTITAVSESSGTALHPSVSMIETLLPQVRTICVTKHPSCAMTQHSYVIQDKGIIDVTVPTDF